MNDQAHKDDKSDKGDRLGQLFDERPELHAHFIQLLGGKRIAKRDPAHQIIGEAAARLLTSSARPEQITAAYVAVTIQHAARDTARGDTRLPGDWKGREKQQAEVWITLGGGRGRAGSEAWARAADRIIRKDNAKAAERELRKLAAQAKVNDDDLALLCQNVGLGCGTDMLARRTGRSYQATARTLKETRRKMTARTGKSHEEIEVLIKQSVPPE